MTAATSYSRGHLTGKSVLFLSDRDGPLHLFKQAIDETQPELLVDGQEALAIPRINSSGMDLLYLVMPKHGQASTNVKIMRMPLNGGPSQVVLEAPGIWNHQCARSLASFCIYTTTEPNQQRFFVFDTMIGASKGLLSARLSDEAEQPNWKLPVFSEQTKMPLFAYFRSPTARERSFRSRVGHGLAVLIGPLMARVFGLRRATHAPVARISVHC